MEMLRNESQVESFFQDFNLEEFSFDTETTSLRYDEIELVGISFSDGTNSCYIPVGHKHKLSGLKVEEQVNVDWLVEYLKEQVFINKRLIIAHNITYDYKVLYKYGINLYNQRWYDTMVASHLIDETSQKGLKHLAMKHLGVDDWDIGSGVKEIQYLSCEEAGSYAIKDALYTYQLYLFTKEQLLDQGLKPLFNKIEMPFLRAITMMEIEGVDVNWEKVIETTKELEDNILKFEEELYTCLEEPYELQMNFYGEVKGIKGKYNFNSPVDLRNIITEKLGLIISRETPTGNPSVGKDTLRDLDGKHEFITILNKYKVAQKLLSGFFNPMPSFRQSDDKIRASFNDTGARTGRMSSSKPNLQQLPKKNKVFPVETRECFRVPKGYKMITADYSGQELRVLAHLTKAEKMIKAFNGDHDFHQATADSFGVSRDKAKTINFGIAYRKGAYGFAKDWGTSEEEAQVYLDKYFEQFPEVKELMDVNDKLLKRDGYVKTITGRRRRFVSNEQGYYPNKDFREAFNFLVQGFSADMIRIAAIKCLNLIKKNPHWRLKMIFTVHDELNFKVKEEYALEASVGIKRCFEEAVKLLVPLKADVHIGNNYGETK